MTKHAFGLGVLNDTPIAFLVITYLSTGLRLYTRIKVKKIYGWDDTLIIIAQLSFTVWCGALLFTYRLIGNAEGFHDIQETHIVAKVCFNPAQSIHTLILFMAVC
jgi:hypothetical protein